MENVYDMKGLLGQGKSPRNKPDYAFSARHEFIIHLAYSISFVNSSQVVTAVLIGFKIFSVHGIISILEFFLVMSHVLKSIYTVELPLTEILSRFGFKWIMMSKDFRQF